MNTNLIIPIVIQLGGVVVVIAEIILPSGGILSLIATGLFGYSLYMVFSSISTAAGIIFLVIDIITIPILIILGLKLVAKSPATLRKKMSKEDGVISQSPELEKLIGMEGITITDLRPAGIAKIDGQRFDVVSRGEYIEQKLEIIVHSVTGNQIIVSKKISADNK